MRQRAELDDPSAVRAADGNGHVLAAGLDRLLIPQAEHAQPPAEVAAAVAPRRTIVRPDGQIDLAAGALKLIGDLHPGRARADHQDGARGQLPGLR